MGSSRENGARPSDAKIISLLMVMVFAWSLNFVISKFALREMPASFIVGIRNLAAGMVILPIYVWERRTLGRSSWTWREAPILFGLGFLGVAMNQMFFILGISRTTVAHAAVMIGLAPVSTMIVAVIFGQEYLNLKRLTGMILAIAGIGVLQLAHFTAAPAPNKAGPSVLGDFFIYLSGLAYALFAVLGKRYTSRHSGITMNTFAYAGSGVALFPVAIWSAQSVDVTSFTWRAWASVAYMAIFSSVMGYLILYWALHWMPASRVSTFTYAQPVMATILGILILHEAPGTSLYLGGALVLAGVIVSERL